MIRFVATQSPSYGHQVPKAPLYCHQSFTDKETILKTRIKPMMPLAADTISFSGTTPEPNEGAIINEALKLTQSLLKKLTEVKNKEEASEEDQAALLEDCKSLKNTIFKNEPPEYVLERRIPELEVRPSQIMTLEEIYLNPSTEPRGEIPKDYPPKDWTEASNNDVEKLRTNKEKKDKDFKLEALKKYVDDSLGIVEYINETLQAYKKPQK